MHFLSRLFCQTDSRRDGPSRGDTSQWSEKPARFATPKPEKRKRPEKAEKPDKRARPGMRDRHDRRGQRPLYSAKPPPSMSSSSSSTGSKEGVYSMASLEMQISKNLDPLLKWAAEKEFSAENIVFLRAVRDFKKKWTMVAKQEQQRLRPRPLRRPLGRSRAYYTTLSQRHDDGMPATPNGATIDDRCLAPELRRERYEDAASIWFTLVNPLTARFNINIDYRTYSELEALFHGLRWRPFCRDPTDDGASGSSRSDKSDNMVAPWDGYEPDLPRRLPQRASGAVPLSDVDRLYKIPVTEVALADDDDDDDEDEDAAGAGSMFTGDGATLSTEAETRRLKVPSGFGIDVFDRAYESVKTDVFLNTWPNYEAAFAVRCSGPAARRDSERRDAHGGDGLLKRAADRVMGRGARR
jgi:hypothetical protein